MKPNPAAFISRIIDLEEIARRGARNKNRAGQRVNKVEIGVRNLFGRRRCGNLAVERVACLDLNFFANLDFDDRRDRLVPAIVAFVRLSFSQASTKHLIDQHVAGLDADASHFC